MMGKKPEAAVCESAAWLSAVRLEPAQEAILASTGYEMMHKATNDL
jgi:hypothetical protein